MKIWQKYSQYLLSGEWHIHTSYTDGLNTVDEYCKKAESLGIPLVAFTEHVRKQLTYDFNAFLNDISKAQKKYDIIILSGCESKVLSNGELDVTNNILSKVDYPLFAFHSFPNNLDLYINNLKYVIKANKISTWAHPGNFLVKNKIKIEEDELKKIYKLLKKNNILFELNSKYNLPASNWIKLAKKSGVFFVRGSDVHSIKELNSNQNIVIP